MMYDDLNAPEDHSDPQLGFQPRSKTSETGRALPNHLPDREVPIPNGGPTAVLHQWLDGEVSIAVVRATQGGNDSVDLWNKIHDEAETLRSRTTPLYVHKRIMDSLPEDTYRGRPWYKRTFALNPATMLVAAAALFGIGAIVAHAVLK